MTKKQLKARIRQLEASCDDMEEFLSEHEFQDYCDHIYSCISYYRQCLNTLRKLEEPITKT